MLWETDTNYESNILTRVEEHSESYSLGFDFWSIGMPKMGVVPKIGDSVKLYGRGAGFPVRGLVINEQVVYYRTAEKQEEYQLLLAERYNLNKKLKYFVQRSSLESKFLALPEVFQRRITRLRSNNPDFRWQGERYELFTAFFI